MLKASAYAPYCSGAIQRASKIPSRKFEPENRPKSRIAIPPLVTQGINFLKMKSRLNGEIRSSSPLVSSIASSVGLREVNTGTKDLLNPGLVAFSFAAGPEPAGYRSDALRLTGTQPGRGLFG